MNQSIQAEIITIGDEILIGQTIDTNSAWLGEHLDASGYQVQQITSISDQPSHIVRALHQALSRVDLVIITGGLGPTGDDRTKQSLADFFEMPLKKEEAVLENIRRIFGDRGVPMLQMNENQAFVPDGCLVLNNPQGTAPGMLFQRDGKVVVSLPGVPYEMKSIAEEHLLPWLRKNLPSEPRVFRMIMTTGYAESMLATKLEPWESGLPENFSLAYLPSPGIVKLRLTTWGMPVSEMEVALEEQIEKLEQLIPEAIYSYMPENLEETIGRMLLRLKLSVGTAESCTGGKISSYLTSVPGSSAYFKGSVIAYAYEAKRNLLGIDQAVLNKYGAVSRPVVTAMADQVRRLLHLDYAIATSGIAGPGGGTSEKPVGLVWIAVASSKQIVSRRFHFGNQRDRNIIRASIAGLNMLRLLLLEEHAESLLMDFQKSAGF